MNTGTIIEAVGYLGSALVLVSFLMASVVKLRVVNSVGSAIFAVYALIIHSYPTAIMNICLLLINIYYLWKLRKTAPEYRMVTLSPGEGYVRFFLDSHREDIATGRTSPPASPAGAGTARRSTAPGWSATARSPLACCWARRRTACWTSRSTTAPRPTATARWAHSCLKTCPARCASATAARRRSICPISSA